MTLTAARQVADAVLYEGYLLYPYRASSSKNQVRWQFGVLGPPGAAAAGVGEEPAMSCEVVLQAQAAATLDLEVRFLHVQARAVQRRTDDGWVPVDELRVGGTRWIPFHEAVSREIPLLDVPVHATRSIEVGLPGGQDFEELHEHGRLVGRLVRTRWPLQATVTVTTRPGTDPRLVVLGIAVHNHTGWDPADLPGWTARDVAARSSFVGTHLLLTAQGSSFVSLLDGPDWTAVDAASCTQSRCWPVLVADDDGKDAVLVAPIILGDHPTIAPESAGDLFDATEIDEILTLRVMTMTEGEKADARGTDPRAAAILARCDAMTDDAMDRLHGGQRPAAPLLAGNLLDPYGACGPGAPTLDDVPVHHDEEHVWDAGLNGGADPEKDSVLVAGVPISSGSRVLLRPSRRADAQDVFLGGMTAVVARVYFDLDGGTHLAVRLEDDPATDLYEATGRFYYFGPEEVEPLPARTDPADAP